MKRVLLVLSLLVGFTSAVLAISGGVSGTQITVTYTEPSTNELDYLGNTTTLDDLKHTSIYYQVVGATYSVVASVVPATTPSGGASVTKSIIVPMQPKRKTTYTIWATATDVSGNESANSPSFNLIVDLLAPAPPK